MTVRVNIWESQIKKLSLFYWFFLLKSTPSWLTSAKLHHWGHTIIYVMFTFTASRTSGEVQHNFGDTSLHSRFGSQHFGRFPAICGLKNVMLPETSKSLKIWRGSEEYKQVLLLHLLKICPFCSTFFFFHVFSWCSKSYLIFTII